MKEIYIKRNLKYTKQGQGFYCSQVFQIKGGFDKGVLFPLERNKEPIFFLEREKVAIPAMQYPLARDFTGKHQYLKILNVPDRYNIEIHTGNYLRDTMGCPLVGQNYHEEKEYSNQDVIIGESVDTCRWLVDDFILNDEEKKMTKKASQDEIVGFITIN